jgi:hypothetical protein
LSRSPTAAHRACAATCSGTAPAGGTWPWLDSSLVTQNIGSRSPRALAATAARAVSEVVPGLVEVEVAVPCLMPALR